mmetsp:Transcript_37042/g.88742  ORF Transcript_37042/g.88742 Transcript_37042/m.88742 type:complete len:336 (-) Transcript_37042:113-1120(-)
MREFWMVVLVLDQVVEESEVQALAPELLYLGLDPPKPRPVLHLCQHLRASRSWMATFADRLGTDNVALQMPMHDRADLVDDVRRILDQVLVQDPLGNLEASVLHDLVVHAHVLVVEVHGALHLQLRVLEPVARILPRHVAGGAGLPPLRRRALDARILLPEGRAPGLQRGDGALDDEEHDRVREGDVRLLAEHLVERLRAARGDGLVGQAVGPDPAVQVSQPRAVVVDPVLLPAAGPLQLRHVVQLEQLHQEAGARVLGSKHDEIWRQALGLITRRVDVLHLVYHLGSSREEALHLVSDVITVPEQPYNVLHGVVGRPCRLPALLQFRKSPGVCH